MKGAFTTVDLLANDGDDQAIKAGTQYIFSKARLAEFMNNLINSESK